MNRLVLIWLTSVMCAASSVSAQEMTDEDIAKLRELFKQGRDHYNRKEYEKSNKSYEEVLERLPKADLDINTAMVLFNIGGNYALLGQKEKAFESLEKAVSRGFWDADALENAPDLASLRGADGFDDLLKKSQAGLGGDLAQVSADISGGKLRLSAPQNESVEDWVFLIRKVPTERTLPARSSSGTDSPPKP